MAPVLVLAAIAGFLLGSCAGGDSAALTTATDRTATRPGVTATRPDVTATRPTVPTRTVTTTEPPQTVTTIEPPQTVTAVETETTLVPVRPATTGTVSTPPSTVAAESTSSTSDAPWGWIALGVALVVALLTGVLIWRRGRSRAASWSAQLASLTRRSLVALDDVVRDGSLVTGEIQALAAEARSLQSGAPDDQSRATAAPIRAGLDDLAGTLETDRALRLGSPPPSTEQISYSTALINRKVEQLQGVLRPPPAPDTPPERAF